MSDLAQRLRTQADMIHMGERIAWGSETALMHEAADELTRLRRQVEVLREGIKDAHGAQMRYIFPTLHKALAEADKISNGGEIRQGDASTRKDEVLESSSGLRLPSPTHTREELVEVALRGCGHNLSGNTVYRADMKRALDALIAIGAVRVK